ncbi:MAG: hypothetical protein ABIM36_04150 [candidate division WOR-3 bacterium]
MKGRILIILIFITGGLFSKEIIKIGSFTLQKVEKKEVRTKIENLIIKKIEGDMVYLKDGNIKLEEIIENIILSNPKFITDLSGNPKKINEIEFPIVADIEAIIMQGEFFENLGEGIKVLKIIIKGKAQEEKEE